MAREPGRMFRQLNGLMSVGCLVLLVAAVWLGHTILTRKVEKNRKNPIAVLDSIARAQRLFMFEDRDGDGKRQAATSLSELAKFDLVSKDLANGAVEGYRYSLSVTTTGWQILATPVGEGSEKKAHLLRNQSDFVWQAVGHPATEKDKLLSSPGGGPL